MASLLTYYEKFLMLVCDRLKFATDVKATGVVFFKRYYLKHSVLETSPREMLFGCLYLACKIEENIITAENLSNLYEREWKKTIAPETILNCETKLIVGLDYQLTLHHPFIPLHGICCKLNQVSSGSISVQVEKKAREMAMQTLNSDSIFHYTPSQIALSSLYYSLPDKTILSNFLESNFKTEEESHQRLALIFKQIYPFLIGESLSQDFAKSVDKKIASFKKKYLPDKSKKRKKVPNARNSNKSVNPDSKQNSSSNKKPPQKKVKTENEPKLEDKKEDRREEEEEFVIRTTLKRY